MSMPFYVSPEQVMADKAEFAQGDRARQVHRALEHQGGVLMMAENATKLNKIGEIYDRLAYCGVGKFSEFDQLRKVGVRFADTRLRVQPRGRARAKPGERVLAGDRRRVHSADQAARVRDHRGRGGDDRYEDHKSNSLYRIKYDGFISDHPGFVAIGGTWKRSNPS